MASPLIVDVKDHPGASLDRPGALDLGLGGAVKIAMDRCPLEECPLKDEFHEARSLDEVVIAAIDLVGSRRTRRVRDAETQFGTSFQEHARQGGLARAAR